MSFRIEDWAGNILCYDGIFRRREFAVSMEFETFDDGRSYSASKRIMHSKTRAGFVGSRRCHALSELRKGVTMLTENTKIKFMPKDKNPYEENTPSWHVFIDCSWGNMGTIGSLVECHGQSLEYYQVHLSTLVADGLVEVSNEE